LAKPWLAHYEECVPLNFDYPRFSLPEIFEKSCAANPDKAAVCLILRHLGPISVGGSLTYRQLLDEVNCCAAALASLGVRRGDRVALMLPNLPQFIIAFHGVLKLGAVVVNTNPTYAAREMQQQFVNSGAESVVLLSPMYGRLQGAQAHTHIRRVLVTDIADDVPSPFGLQARRTLLRQGLMVDVPQGEGINCSGLCSKGIPKRLRRPPCSRRTQRCCAVHGRHNRHSKGRDTEPLEPDRQRHPDAALHASTRRRLRALHGRPALAAQLRFPSRFRSASAT
jgi:acyl-CoA synthetase (AMP-forming)/AMP-acid ligase II